MGLSRGEFFARIGLLSEVDPLTDLAYRFAEQRDALLSDQGAAVKDKWHVSFHGSQFPGNDPKACGRASLYRMIDTPRTFGSYLFSNRKLTQIADAGKDIEDRLVMKWHEAGFLVSPPPFDPFGNKQDQLVFQHPEAWLTSTVDSIVLWPRSVMPIVSEVKSKYANVIADMQRLIRGPDEKHVKQIKTQIAMARYFYTQYPLVVQRCFNTDRLAIPLVLNGDGAVRLVCPQHMTTDCLYEAELVPPEYGYLYYVSRDNPIDTFEFYIEYDPSFYEAGIAKLVEWRKNFENDELPQTNFKEKRFAHPFGWLWGDQPCKWCDFGDICRSDMKKALAEQRPLKLSESAAIEDALAARSDYSYEEARKAVVDRWKKAA